MITSLLLLPPLLIEARMPLAFSATWAHCWLMLCHALTNPQILPSAQLASCSTPSKVCAKPLSSKGCLKPSKMSDTSVRCAEHSPD